MLARNEVSAGTKQVKRQQFTVCGSNGYDYDWRWPDGYPVWRKSSKEGARWYDEPLDESDRLPLLCNFGLALDGVFDTLPLETLVEMSPASLIAIRREIEEEHKFLHLDVRCERTGGPHIPAEEAD